MIFSNITPVRSAAITPTDEDEDLPSNVIGIYVGSEGDITACLQDGEFQVWKNVPAGTQLAGAFKQVRNTGTDADDLIALIGS